MTEALDAYAPLLGDVKARVAAAQGRAALAASEIGPRCVARLAGFESGP